MVGGHKAFSHLGPKIRACKGCVARHHLVFYGLSHMDVDLHSVGFCEICGKFKPLMEVRNKRRHSPFGKKKEERRVHKIERRSG